MTKIIGRLIDGMNSFTTRDRLFAAALVALWSTSLMPAWSNSDTVWKLSYIAAFYNRCDVLIAPSAVKVVNQDGIELVAKAPKWDGYVINPHTKAICVLPYATWYARKFFMNVDELESTSTKHIVDERTTFMGMPAVHYSYKGRVIDGLWQDRQRPIDCTNQYYGTTDIPMTDAQRDIITAWFGLPRTKEFPLFWGRIFSDGSKHYTLKLLTVSKQKLQGDLFAIPGNCKKANTVYEVFEHQNRDLMDSIAGFAANQPLAKDKSGK
jgi:hypothetical protein